MAEQVETEIAFPPNEPFNGAELSESVLAREWNSPEEDDAWSNL